MKLSKVLLRTSSDPNMVGQAIGSALLKGSDFDLRMSEDRNWVILNGTRWIPRELVLHADAEEEVSGEDIFPMQGERPKEGLPTLACSMCDFTTTSQKGLGTHARAKHATVKRPGPQDREDWGVDR